MSRQDVIVALVVFAVGGAILATIGYFVQAVHEDRVARALRETGITKNAASAPDTPPRVPARAPACAAKGHVIPGWAHNAQVWFCVREGCDYTAAYPHDDDLPYDQEAVAVFDAARAITRESAGGAA